MYSVWCEGSGNGIAWVRAERRDWRGPIDAFRVTSATSSIHQRPACHLPCSSATLSIWRHSRDSCLLRVCSDKSIQSYARKVTSSTSLPPRCFCGRGCPIADDPGQVRRVCAALVPATSRRLSLSNLTLSLSHSLTHSPSRHTLPSYSTTPSFIQFA